MNDHNLDDLIIDDIEPKRNKTKSLLTIVALLIVVFIVAIILTSVVLEDPKSDTLLLEENDTEMVSPELTLQSVTKPKKEKKEPKLTEIIEKELNKPLQAPKLTETPKPKEKVAAKPIIEKEVEKSKTIKTPNQKNESQSVEITKEFEQTPAKPKVNSIPEVKNTPETVVLTPTAKKKAKKESVTKPAASNIKYYIQVGSYKQTPSKRFLSVIKNNGFNYKITAPAANGIKKLLVGPYADRNAVDIALVRVRDLINKNAFVVKK